MYATTTATPSTTIEWLRHDFATHGLSHILVRDNGLCFTSSKFAEFTQRNGIQHKCINPHHQATNCLAERSVVLVKNELKMMSGGTQERKISRFLLSYRTTLHTTTWIIPAELLMKRRLQNNLDCMKPATSTTVYNNQEDQKFQYDKTNQMRSFSKGQAVFAQNFRLKPMWLAGWLAGW